MLPVILFDLGLAVALFGAIGLVRPARRLGMPGSDVPESILAAPAGQPILAVALRSGFMLLGEEPGREIVLGTLVATPPELRHLEAAELERLRTGFDAASFRALAAPGYARAATSFRWSDAGDGWTRLVTETRVHATDAGTSRRFALYWRLIYPGSSWIRRAWLAAIRDRCQLAPS